MTLRAPLFSAKNQLFPKAILCLLFVSAFTLDIFSQRLTFQDYKSKFLKELSSSDKIDTLILFEAKDNPFGRFTSRMDFYKVLKLIARKADEYRVADQAQIFAIVGKKMHYNGFYEDAYYYLYKADKLIAEKAPEDRSFYAYFHESYGLSLYYYGRFSDAKPHFKQALKGSEWTPNQYIGILNSLGLVYRDMKDIDSAKYYFSRGLSKAKKLKLKGWIGVLSGNLGHIYYLQGNYDEAARLCMVDYNLSQETDQLGSAINAGYLLIEIRIAQGRLKDAEKMLKEIEFLVFNRDYQLQEHRVLYKARNLVYQAQGNYREALNSYKMASLYDDTVRSLTAEENLKKTEFQIHFEQKQSELSLVREKEHFNEWMITILSLLIGSIIICSFLIIRGIIRRRRRENQLLELKKERAERELAHTEKEMRTILSNLIEKNALVEQLTSEIEGFQNDVDSKFNEERSKMLERLQSITLLTDDDWLEFKKLFERLNPNFFSRLLQAAPDLTNAEIRLVTLIKLNLSNLEMARVLGISPDSVRKTGLRLRKKWNIEHQDELVKFVLNL